MMSNPTTGVVEGEVVAGEADVDVVRENWVACADKGVEPR
jgi:hypothetical protein